MADSELRQRKAQVDKPVDAEPKKSRAIDADNDDSPWVDILRVLSFLVVASFGLSYVVTGGSSWTWGGVQLPEYMRADWWKEQLVRVST